MTPNLSSQEPLLLPVAQQDLTLSVLLPFEPRTQSRKQIEASVRRLMVQAEERLLQQTSRQVTREVLDQLKQLFDQLDYGATAKSVALWATPSKGKLVYWQMPVGEAVVLDQHFDVRQLLPFRKEEKQYLLLVMGDHFAGIYLGKEKQLSRLVANAPVSVGRGIDPALDAAQQKQVVLQRSVKHFDDALSILQRAYKLPVFIVAPAAHLAQFRKQSRNAAGATALVEVPATINERELQAVVAPYLANWQQLKAAKLMTQLEDALQAGKLAVGIGEVWTAANQKRGRLLVVEADYAYPAYIDNQGGVLYSDTIPLSQTNRQTRDAVSDAMSCVLAGGGTVEIVENGTLADYLHAALICY
ncbi:hypothetical protein SAMN05444008_108150 [Cnuella takakiae]|uniref:Peptide chain release factor 1 (ERF1) n=1 Tax=Cnuella takakiae TaxID=1302690 RepID=A0A1M5BYQ9_9BACT|nr:hypothetical protein [Cnuella takakiae]OLY93558.1 hypothetical protein BUE76_18020 [Cnuella takakiae]SHF47526.1 hypothetical protein SAMN05444008_108150 [Cnuella takakiae]